MRPLWRSPLEHQPCLGFREKQGKMPYPCSRVSVDDGDSWCSHREKRNHIRNLRLMSERLCAKIAESPLSSSIPGSWLVRYHHLPHLSRHLEKMASHQALLQHAISSSSDPETAQRVNILSHVALCNCLPYFLQFDSEHFRGNPAE